jgi:hypothetical protein
MKTAAGTIFALALLFLAHGAYAVTRFGDSDCDSWAKLQRATDKTYLLGFLNGMAVVWWNDKKQPQDPLDAMSDVNQAFAWMDKYCQVHPLSSIWSGAQELFYELAEKKRHEN